VWWCHPVAYLTLVSNSRLVVRSYLISRRCIVTVLCVVEVDLAIVVVGFIIRSSACKKRKDQSHHMASFHLNRMLQCYLFLILLVPSLLSLKQLQQLSQPLWRSNNYVRYNFLISTKTTTTRLMNQHKGHEFNWKLHAASPSMPPSQQQVLSTARRWSSRIINLLASRKCKDLHTHASLSTHNHPS